MPSKHLLYLRLMIEDNTPSKEKTIAVRFFLNTELQPEELKDSKGIVRKGYSLYLHVTYNRKSMRFKSKYGSVYTDLNKVDSEDPGIMDFERKLIEKVIRFEHRLLGMDKPYEMKGLKDRYEIYTDSLASVIEKYLRPKLLVAINGTNSELVYALDLKDHRENKNHVLLLYSAAEKLFNNFSKQIDQTLKAELETYRRLFDLLNTKIDQDYPLVIDSLDDEFRSEFGKTLERQKNSTSNYITRAFNLIDIAVRDTVKKMYLERQQNKS